MVIPSAIHGNPPQPHRFRGFAPSSPAGPIQRISPSALSGTAKAKIPEVKGPLEALTIAQTHETPTPAKDVLIKFTVPYKTSFGQVVKVVGENKKLGAWSVNDALKFTWTEGDNWVGQLTLPPGKYEFKIIVEDTAGGNTEWEKGVNRVLEIPAFPGTMEVPCIFNTPTMQTTFIDAPVEALDPIEVAARAAAAAAVAAEAAAKAAAANDTGNAAELTAKAAAAAEKVAAQAELKVQTSPEEEAKLAAARKSIQDTMVELMNSSEPGLTPETSSPTTSTTTDVVQPPSPDVSTPLIEAATAVIITETLEKAIPEPPEAPNLVAAAPVETLATESVEAAATAPAMDSDEDAGIASPVEEEPVKSDATNTSNNTPSATISTPSTAPAVAEKPSAHGIAATVSTAPSFNNMVAAPAGLADSVAEKTSKKREKVPVSGVTELLSQDKAKLEEMVGEQATKLASLADSPAGKLVNDLWEFLAKGGRK